MPRHPIRLRALGLAVNTTAALLLGGCAGKTAPEPTLRVEPGAYPAAFEAAKDVLRAYAFELDRVDATSGVLTTHARGSAGFATPWVPHASSLGDAGQGFLDRERRRAAVVFEPAASETPAPMEPSGEAESAPTSTRFDPDVLSVLDRAGELDPDAALQARVIVWVERVYRPGRRVGSTSVRLASFTSDPDLKSQGLEPAFARPTRDDPGLEGRMLRAIEARVSTKQNKNAR